MILKPRIATNVAAILAGGFFALIGFGSAIAIGRYAGLVPALFGLLGLFMIVGGVVALSRRGKLAIVIDETGITLPVGNIFRIHPPVRVPREIIATISRHDSIRGRLIEILLRSGDKLPIQARNYCELKDFLAHCKAHGLPTA